VARQRPAEPPCSGRASMFHVLVEAVMFRGRPVFRVPTEPRVLAALRCRGGASTSGRASCPGRALCSDRALCPGSASMSRRSLHVWQSLMSWQSPVFRQRLDALAAPHRAAFRWCNAIFSLWPSMRLGVCAIRRRQGGGTAAARLRERSARRRAAYSLCAVTARLVGRRSGACLL